MVTVTVSGGVPAGSSCSFVVWPPRGDGCEELLPALAVRWMTMLASDATDGRRPTLYGVGSVQVTATAAAAFVIVAAEFPYAVVAGEDAWQLDMTVALTANEVVAVAPSAGLESEAAPSKMTSSVNLCVTRIACT
jgi:hypothetical protein